MLTPRISADLDVEALRQAMRSSGIKTSTTSTSSSSSSQTTASASKQGTSANFNLSPGASKGLTKDRLRAMEERMFSEAHRSRRTHGADSEDSNTAAATAAAAAAAASVAAATAAAEGVERFSGSRVGGSFGGDGYRVSSAGRSRRDLGAGGVPRPSLSIDTDAEQDGIAQFDILTEQRYMPYFPHDLRGNDLPSVGHSDSASRGASRGASRVVGAQIYEDIGGKQPTDDARDVTSAGMDREAMGSSYRYPSTLYSLSFSA